MSRLLLAFVLSGCAVTPPPEPFGPVPSARQLAWHELQYYAFIHFGPNTFTDVEWGDGEEHPEVFNPAKLDARQWVRTFRDAGMEGVIITAKHHDGFALWPSAQSTHTVRESAWRGGEGDVLRELADACREYGLKFGVYVSPWDRNHPAYGSDAYNDVFKAMLEEVLTGYGDLFEVWFDGANGEGPNGKRQEYDFPGFADVVREYQPMAVIFSDAGPDIRWVGNERGYAGETTWDTVRDGAFYPGIPGVNDQLERGHEDGDIWLPPEVDVSIRPGWFYHAEQDDQVKSLGELVDIWFSSVGRGANLLLNVPVDPRGLIHPADSTRLMEFKRYLDDAFSVDLALHADLYASNSRGRGYGASNLVDGDATTFWAAEDGSERAELVVEFDSPTEVNAVLLREHIVLGQRVAAVTVLARSNGWQPVASATTIGNRRIIRFDTIEADGLRIVVEGRAAPVLRSLSLYRVPE